VGVGGLQNNNKKQAKEVTNDLCLPVCLLACVCHPPAQERGRAGIEGKIQKTSVRWAAFCERGEHEALALSAQPSERFGTSGAGKRTISCKRGRKLARGLAEATAFPFFCGSFPF